MKELSLILCNIRSAQNVGSIFRTADALGVTKIYLTGYTPYPKTTKDTRLPHISESATRKISKTALGAEKTMPFEYSENIESLIASLRKKGYAIYALEQAEDSEPLEGARLKKASALVLGNEVKGVDRSILSKVDKIIEIPLNGKKESLNVSVAAAIATYKLLY